MVISVLCLLREGPATLSEGECALESDIGEGKERFEGLTNEVDLEVMSMSCN